MVKPDRHAKTQGQKSIEKFGKGYRLGQLLIQPRYIAMKKFLSHQQLFIGPECPL